MDLFTKGIITILPPIITGIFGFYIAKYQSNRNAPLEKLEIAYNTRICSNIFFLYFINLTLW